MGEDLFSIFLPLLIIYWVVYNIQLIKVAKHLGEDISYIWIPFPIFYFAGLLSMAKKSMWHLLWIALLTIPLSFGSWLIYLIYLHIKIANRLGFSGWWSLIWFVAPFFWVPALKGKKPYADGYSGGYRYECDKCNHKFKTKEEAKKHEKICKIK